METATAVLRASCKEALSTLVGGRTRVDLGETWLAPVISLPAPDTGGTTGVRGSGRVRIGETIAGRYCVEKELGSGAFGHVYLVRHTILNAHSAMKVPRPEAVRDDPSLIERFKREAWATAQVQHPSVVQVTDVAQLEDGQWYIVMEYLQGKSLADELEALGKGGQLAISRVVEIIREVAEAMQAVHLKGIVHRDLKPENIYLVRLPDGTERVKVVDFGIALSTGEADRPGEISGTPMYMAPEQVDGKPADPRSDVHTLGTILYQGLAGRWPHELPTRGSAWERIDAIYAAKRTVEPPLVSKFRTDVPKGIVRLLRDTLAIDPRRRPQSMAEFNKRLGVATVAETTVRQPSRWSRWSWRIWRFFGTIMRIMLIGTVLTAVLAAGLVGWKVADPASFAEFRGVVGQATQVIRKVGGPIVRRVHEEWRNVELPEFFGGKQPKAAPIEAPKVEAAPKKPAKTEAPAVRKTAKRRTKKVRGAATVPPDTAVAAPSAASKP